jgi:hypothetical protein
MGDYYRGLNDQRLAITAQGGQEQQLQQKLAESAWGLNKSERERQANEFTRQFGVRGQTWQMNQGERENAYESLMKKRGLNFAELSQLQGMLGQANIPQGRINQTINVPGATNMGDLMQQGYENQLGAYNAQKAQNQQLYSGLGSMAGGAIGGGLAGAGLLGATTVSGGAAAGAAITAAIAAA